ncbi:MAG: YbhB/YbcL family Raf kinase inhibitor-like protein [Candidatus Thorarchaeota archaeon]
MKLESKNLTEGKPIPSKHAFCVLTPEGKVEMGLNKNPDFSWSNLPETTKSLTLICHDSEVPTSAENVNKEGKVVSKNLARTDFFHWVLYDIPVEIDGIKEGEFSNGITARGKNSKDAPHGTKQGLNNYTEWFKGDENMEGEYYGYDGPCPPWNDERIHKYHFTLYALDVPHLLVPSRTVNGADVLRALYEHILASSSITVTYTLNKDLV